MRGAAARDADAAYDEAIAQGRSTRPADGTLLRGEVLARWQEFVGTGELLKTPGGQGRLAARPDGQRGQGQAAAGRAGHRRGRVGPARR